MQGAFPRDLLGAGYVSVGLPFDHGPFVATGPHAIALARSYDVLIHLHRVEAARLLDR